VNSVPLGYDTPLLLAGDKHICSGALNVETADYGFDDAFLAGLRRRSDIRTGLPSYKYGGNIFEDYDVEDMKGLYQKSTYTPSDVAQWTRSSTASLTSRTRWLPMKTAAR